MLDRLLCVQASTGPPPPPALYSSQQSAHTSFGRPYAPTAAAAMASSYPAPLPFGSNGVSPPPVPSGPPAAAPAPVQEMPAGAQLHDPSQPGPFGQAQAGQQQQMSQPSNMASPSAEAQGGQSQQSGQLSSPPAEAGPFGIAEVSEPDFWGQHDGEGSPDGPFGASSAQHGQQGVDLFNSRQVVPSMPEPWAAAADERAFEQQSHSAQLAAAAPACSAEASSAAEPMSPEDAAAAAPQGPPLLSDAQSVHLSAESQNPHVQQQYTAVSAQPEQHALPQPSAASGATPFGSEYVQHVQTRGSAAPQQQQQQAPDADAQQWQLPADAQQQASASSAPPLWQPKQQALSASTPQDAQSHQGWGSAADSMGHQARQWLQTSVPGQQAPEESLAAQGLQAWGEQQPLDQPHWKAASVGVQDSVQQNGHGSSEAPGQANTHGAVSAHEGPGPAWQEPLPSRGGWHGRDPPQQPQQSAAQHGVPAQGAPFYMPPAPAQSGALFQTWQSTRTAQQKRVPSSADEGAPAGLASCTKRSDPGARCPCTEEPHRARAEF